jgi:pyridoxine 4-dehydrogenase
MSTPVSSVDLNDTITIGERSYRRFGYGAMRLTGPGRWGPPEDHEGALRVLRRAVELGVEFIDTADSYGPYVNEQIIREALHPYPESLLVATKAGLVRTGPLQWFPVGRPKYLRQECEMSLIRLGLDHLDLFQLHRIDPEVPQEEQFGLLRDLRDEGKVRHVGLSNVTVSEIEAARRIVPITSVQNRYNVIERKDDDVVDYCTRHGIVFIPWFPMGAGRIAAGDPAAADATPGPVERVAGQLGVTASQVCLAWLLHRSPAVLPIPGTSSVAHLEENVAAATISLDAGQLALLDAVGINDLMDS